MAEKLPESTVGKLRSRTASHDRHCSLLATVADLRIADVSDPLCTKRASAVLAGGHSATPFRSTQAFNG